MCRSMNTFQTNEQIPLVKQRIKKDFTKARRVCGKKNRIIFRAQNTMRNIFLGISCSQCLRGILVSEFQRRFTLRVFISF